MSKEVKERIETIKNKVENLIAHQQTLIHEKNLLEQKVQELKKLNEIQKSAIKNLEAKARLTEMAAILSDINDKKQLKAKLNDLIRDIDKSLTLLND